MIFKCGEFIEVIDGTWKGKFGQIWKVGDIDGSDYPYMIVFVHEGLTIRCMASSSELRLRKFREAEVQFSEYLRLVKK